VTKPDGTTTGVKAEVLRLQGAGLDDFPEWLGGGAPAAELGMSTPNPRAGVRLTPPERDRYAVLFTQIVKNGSGHTYAQVMQAAMQDPMYWEQSDGVKGTDGGKAAWLGRIDREFSLLTEQALFAETRTSAGEPGTIERTIQRKQAERVIQKVPTAEQGGLREGLIQSLGR